MSAPGSNIRLPLQAWSGNTTVRQNNDPTSVNALLQGKKKELHRPNPRIFTAVDVEDVFTEEKRSVAKKVAQSAVRNHFFVSELLLPYLLL